MDIVQETQSSYPTRFLRWLVDFERAIDMQPVDRLELRVAELERLFATPNPSRNPPQNLSSVHNASEV